MRKKQISIILLIFIFSTLKVFSQTPVSAINLNKIYLKHKKKFINNNYIKHAKTFDDFFPKCINKDSCPKYNTQEVTYIVNTDINTLWNKYKKNDLRYTFSGKLVRFGFLYSKIKHKLIYQKDDYQGLEVGQIVFIRLDLLKGLKKLVVAYEVTNIDNENKSIQFCYLNNGISEGSQKICLQKCKDGKTKIIHETFFKSNSNIRDKYIYPKFHKRIIDELHNNLINGITQDALLTKSK